MVLRISRPATALAWVVLASGCTKGTGPDGEPPPSGATGSFDDTVVVVAVGDIVCGAATRPTFPCRHERTAAIARGIAPHAVLALGDLQYEEGELADFRRFYAASWGVFKDITYPVAGNHEYETPDAEGYFDYFNGVGVDSGRAGRRGQGYYAVRLGAWLVIALNSNCRHVACDPGSPQEQWLRRILADRATRCTLAFMHHPRFSSAERSEQAVVPLWKALQDAGADLVLAGHDHIYERFAPLTATGELDAERGMPSFVVGTGGKNVYGFSGRHVGSEAATGRLFGVLRLALWPGGYSWEFAADSAAEFRDAGRRSCR